MPVIAIIGAGPGMGLAIARVFGRQWFSAALVSWKGCEMHPLVSALADEGIDAVAYEADAADPDSLAPAIEGVMSHFGSIDVLAFAPPDPAGVATSAVEITRADAQGAVDSHVHAPIAAVRAVLPEMLARRSGTILFTTRSPGPSRDDAPRTLSPAAEWLRSWAHALHAEVAPRGVQVAHVAVDGSIIDGERSHVDTVARLHWELHTRRNEAERVFTPPRPLSPHTPYPR